MAIPTNIHTLLSGEVVEWARIEFKESWDPEASLKTVCAFANDLDHWGGGYIVIGVKEDQGLPVYPLSGIPLDKIDAYQKNIFEKCKLIRPSYMPIIEVVDYEGKKFIVLWCPGGEVRPYSSPKSLSSNSKERVHYIRKGSSTVIPSTEEEKDLFALANRIPFDDRINHHAELSDLNITLIQNYLKEIKSSLYEKSLTGNFLDICRDMNIISVLPEYVKPKNVGLMFFSMNPDKFFPYAQIDIVQFPDGLGGDHIIEKTFKGPIHQQLRDALQYIRNAIITERVVKYPDRAEADRFFNYPYAAIEEALANAVYHRGYDEREPIEVRVENDRIEIVSFPGPDRSVTIEGLQSYRVSNRRYRNRRIGDYLKEMHLTEGRNTGFKKILLALENNGSPKPEFETDEDRSYFISRFFIHEGFLEKRKKDENSLIQIGYGDRNNGQSDERSLSEVLSEVLDPKSFHKYIDLVTYLDEYGQITPKEAEQICMKSPATVRRYLKELVETTYVTVEGHTSNLVYKGIFHAKHQSKHIRNYFASKLTTSADFLKESSITYGNNDQSNERSLSEVLSEVLDPKSFHKYIDLVTYLDEYGQITPKEAERICMKSPATVRRYLKELVEMGCIEVEGETNRKVYRVSPKVIHR